MILLHNQTAGALIAVAIALGACGGAGGVAMAQAPNPDDHPGHHPASDAAQAPAARAMPAERGRMGGMRATAAGGGGMMPANMPRMMQMMCRSMAMHAQMGLAGMMPLRHIEGEIAFYKAELRITDSQAPQWNAFADAMRGQATAGHAAWQGMSQSDVAAVPDMIEHRIVVLSARLEAMKTMLTAFKPLYAVLSDDQKKITDALLTERGMAVGPGMGMGMGGTDGGR
jgi:hypothetical protein